METQERVRRRTAQAARTKAKAGGKANRITPDTELDMRQLLRALQAVRDGDFSVRLPSDQTGMAGKISDTFNDIVASTERMASEVERAGQMVGKEGKTRHRIALDRRSGAWGAMEGDYIPDVPRYHGPLARRV
jgi:methyl-accepting chemotaxis protein